MKPVQYISIFLIAFLSLTGCEEDVYAPLAKSPYPVVYCVLNKSDSAHYVRLTKSFSGPVDALVMAQNPDSLYYKNARVYAEWCGGKTELLPTNDIKRDDGILFSDYSLLYKTTDRLQYGVRIHIYLPDYDTEVFGSTSMMNPPVFTNPNPLLKKVLNFYEENYVTVLWDGIKPACQTVIRFKYLEIKDQGMDTCHLDWVRKSADFTILPGDLLDYFNHWIKDNPEVRYRKVLGFDILASTGNAQMADYMTYKDWNIDYIDRPYSNLINAYGLVAARTNGALTDYLPNQKFIDSLMLSPKTEHLKFVRW